MAGDRLFLNMDFSQVREMFVASAAEAVETVTDSQFRQFGLDVLAEQLVADKVPRQIVLDTGNHEIDTRIVTIPARQGLVHMGISIPSARQPSTEAIEVTLQIPYTGSRQAFTFRPSQIPSDALEAIITDKHVILSVTQADTDSYNAEQILLGQERILQRWVGLVNADITHLERHVRSLVTGRLNQRKELRLRHDQLRTTFTIPLRHVNLTNSLEIPVQPITATLSPGQPAGDGRQPDWRLADTVYEQMIGTVIGFARALERRPASALQLIPAEETLRDWLLFLLNANYEGIDGSPVFVAGETVNGSGKTDILIRHQGLNAFIGECKFWDGPSKFDEAINQLLSYTVWRDTKAAIILFITRRNATAAINQATKRLTCHPQYRRTKTAPDPSQRRDFLFASPHDQQRAISLALLPVVVTAATTPSRA